MKKLFFLLLVVNLVIWLWGQREQLARVTQTGQPEIGVIRLLDQAELDARREQAKREAEARPVTAADGAAASGPPVVASAAADDDREPTSAEGSAAPSPGAGLAQTRLEELPTQAPSPSEPPPSAVAPTLPHEPQPSPEPAVVAAAEDEAPASTPPPGTLESPTTVADAVAAAPQDSPAVAGAPVPAEPVADASPPIAMPSATAPAEVAREAATEPAAGQPAAPVKGPAMPDAAAPIALSPPAVEGGASSPGAAAEPSLAGETSPNRTGSDVAPTSVPTASLAASPPPPAPVASPVEPREVPYVCESIGPFADRAAAARTQAGLAEPLRGATIREERSSRLVRHWVLAPVQPSKEATADYLTSLGQAGVKDAWRIPSGPLAGRLAVGVFQSAENARKHADMLASKGVPAEVHAPKDLEPVRAYWVDYGRPADAPLPDVGAGRGQRALQIVSRPCGRVAGP